jgi:hypothetical protein
VSQIRQLIISLDIMISAHKHISKTMRPVELIGDVISQGGSIGSTKLLPLPPSGAMSMPHGPPSTCSIGVVPSTTKK